MRKGDKRGEKKGDSNGLHDKEREKIIVRYGERGRDRKKVRERDKRTKGVVRRRKDEYK